MYIYIYIYISIYICVYIYGCHEKDNGSHHTFLQSLDHPQAQQLDDTAAFSAHRPTVQAVHGSAGGSVQGRET